MLGVHSKIWGVGHGHTRWGVRPAFVEGVGSYLPKDVSLLHVSAPQMSLLKHLRCEKTHPHYAIWESCQPAEGVYEMV